ncbi:hypothetical protein [Actinomadura sp. 3N508]|uniref:hypothetical protein n=1 Tax=Actinomadura sp. 3N508 TaxID=3375153 RepID=UPI0037A88426
MRNRPDQVRAAHIDAGDLIEAPADLARDARFGMPVALTRAAHDDCVAWTDADAARTGAIQDENGRWYDVLYMAGRALHRMPSNGRAQIAFQVCRVASNASLGENGDIEPKEVALIPTRRRDDDGFAPPSACPRTADLRGGGAAMRRAAPSPGSPRRSETPPW